MKRVGLRKLHTELRNVIDDVERNRQSITVTRHGQAICTINPLTHGNTRRFQLTIENRVFGAKSFEDLAAKITSSRATASAMVEGDDLVVKVQKSGGQSTIVRRYGAGDLEVKEESE